MCCAAACCVLLKSFGCCREGCVVLKSLRRRVGAAVLSAVLVAAVAVVVPAGAAPNPEGPVGVEAVSGGAGEIVVSWSALSPVPTDYRVHFVPADESFADSGWSDTDANVFTSAPGVTLSGLVEGGEYKIRVRARWSDGTSKTRSQFSSAVTAAAGSAAAWSGNQLRPTGLAALAEPGAVTLSWSAPVGDASSVTGYRVLRRRMGSEDVVSVLVSDTADTGTSYVDDTADEDGVTYRYRVEALRGGDVSRSSAFAQAQGQAPIPAVQAQGQAGGVAPDYIEPVTMDLPDNCLLREIEQMSFQGYWVANCRAVDRFDHWYNWSRAWGQVVPSPHVEVVRGFAGYYRLVLKEDNTIVITPASEPPWRIVLRDAAGNELAQSAQGEGPLVSAQTAGTYVVEIVRAEDWGTPDQRPEDRFRLTISPPSHRYQKVSSSRLASLELSGLNMGDFDAEQLVYFADQPVGGLSRTTVTALPSDADRFVDIEPTDADLAVGHQVDLVGDDSTEIAVTVSHPDGLAAPVTYRVVVRSPSAANGPQSLRVGDDYSGDTDTTAELTLVDTTGLTHIARVGTASGVIESSDDHDWWRVELKEMHRYSIMMKQTGSPTSLGDPMIKGIYDSNGVMIAGTGNDDAGGPNEYDFAAALPETCYTDYFCGGPITENYPNDVLFGLPEECGSVHVCRLFEGFGGPNGRDSWVRFYPKQQPGTYYIAVGRGMTPTSIRQNGDYLLEIHEELPEIGNKPDSARTIEVGVPAMSRIDKDPVKKSAQETDQSEEPALPSRPDSSDGPDSDSWDWDSWDESDPWRDNQGRYSAELEPDIYSGKGADHDWWRVELEQNKIYVIDMLGRDTGNGTLGTPELVRLRTENRAPIDATQVYEDFGGTENDRLVFAPQTTGDYYIVAFGSEFSDPTRSEIGTYTLQVTEVPTKPDVVASAATTASVTADGPRYEGRIDHQYDIDWIAVELQGGLHYDVKIRADNNSLIPLRDVIWGPGIGGVYDSSRNLLPGSSNPTTQQNWGIWHCGPGSGRRCITYYDNDAHIAPETDGVYYIDARAFEHLVGDYWITVEAVPAPPISSN